MNRLLLGILVPGVCLFTSVWVVDARAQDGPVAPAQTCGDGVIDTGETCDDGNTTAGDGCSPTCMEECPDKIVGLKVQRVIHDGDILDVRGTLATDQVVVRLCPPNLRVASILSRLDINGDGVPDNSPDTDGDGLPDNWELGGVETVDLDGDGRPDDRVVFYPAPTAVVPGTPPTPIFTRRAVATSALNADTDGDGLSDFVEVFGLAFIDDNADGILDPAEWSDRNDDGLPSPGERPVASDTQTRDPRGGALLHDFDGFVFTDPTNPDTDGDGPPDSEDREPLINPRSFGLRQDFIVRFEVEDNPDIDKDGLGNGMDMGNDLLTTEAPGLREDQSQVIDNPQNVRELLALFREDLLQERAVPESTIEDLIGADWDGNGLWRTTDVREWSLIIDDGAGIAPPPEFFRLDPVDPGTNLYSQQSFDDLAARYDQLRSADKLYGGRGIGLGWQEILKPSSTDQFVPDTRIWAILYAWRMPGFDIDGDGFIGVPNLSSTFAVDGRISVALERTTTTSLFSLTDDVPVGTRADDLIKPFDDRIDIAAPSVTDPQLDGVVEAPDLAQWFRGLGCGAMGLVSLMGMVTSLTAVRLRRRRAPHAHTGG